MPDPEELQSTTVAEVNNPRQERLEAGYDNFVRRNMADYVLSNPGATDEELAAHEEGLRQGIRVVFESNSQDANPDAIETEKREQERLEVAEDSGDLATEQEVRVAPETVTTDKRVAELEAYAMKPYEDEMAADRTANSTPVQYIPGEDGKTHQIGGVNLSTELKQKHWSLNSKANFAAQEAVRMDTVARDPSRNPVERQVAQDYLDMLTDPNRTYESVSKKVPQPPVPENNTTGEKPAEEFNMEEWAEQHDLDPEQNKALYETVASLRNKFGSNWEAARKDQLPKEVKNALRNAGRNSVNITKNIIEAYFDPSYQQGLEQHGAGQAGRDMLKKLFDQLALFSQYKNLVKNTAPNEASMVTPRIDIYEDPQEALKCLQHTFDVSRDPNDPKAIAYGNLSMQILEALRLNLAIKVPGVDKSKFEQIILSLQANERTLSQTSN